MRRKLVIFDLDGTILDTLQDLADSVNTALVGSGLPKRTVQEVRAFVGNGIRNLIERSVPQGTPANVVDKVFADFKAHYQIHCADKTCPYEGITDMLNKLKRAGVMSAVVSNKADGVVQELCNKYFKGQLDYAVGEKAGILKKPAPDSIHSLLHAMNTANKDAVYVGDSEVDILTAQNAGLDCIIVDWGFRDREDLIEKGAKVVVSSVHELEKALLE